MKVYTEGWTKFYYQILFFQLNPGRVGFYRVSYSSDLFSPLLPALRDLPPQDRLGLQNDAFALVRFSSLSSLISSLPHLLPFPCFLLLLLSFLTFISLFLLPLIFLSCFIPSPSFLPPPLQARAGEGNTVDLLRLFASYAQETNYTVWENLVSNLSTLKRLFSYTDFYDSFKQFARKIFGPTVAKLGWDAKDTDSEPLNNLRAVIFTPFSLPFFTSLFSLPPFLPPPSA